MLMPVLCVTTPLSTLMQETTLLPLQRKMRTELGVPDSSYTGYLDIKTGKLNQLSLSLNQPKISKS